MTPHDVGLLAKGAMFGLILAAAAASWRSSMLRSRGSQPDWAPPHTEPELRERAGMARLTSGDPAVARWRRISVALTALMVIAFAVSNAADARAVGGDPVVAAVLALAVIILGVAAPLGLITAWQLARGSSPWLLRWRPASHGGRLLAAGLLAAAGFASALICLSCWWSLSLSWLTVN